MRSSIAYFLMFSLGLIIERLLDIDRWSNKLTLVVSSTSDNVSGVGTE